MISTMNRIFFIFVILLVFLRCNKKTTKSSYIYKNGNMQIEFKLLNQNKYIKYNEKTYSLFILKNIDPTFSFIGPGIKFIKRSNDTIYTTIFVKKEYVNQDTLNIKLIIKNKLVHIFKIPLLPPHYNTQLPQE